MSMNISARHFSVHLLGATFLFGMSASTSFAAEVVLKTQTALPKHHDLSASFLKLFVEKLNSVGKGVVTINYIGGPEVTPARKAAPALKRGVFDILHTPVAYHVGIIPHGQTLMATNLTVGEYRKAGALDILEPIWEKKLNAKILGLGETGAQFYLYTVKKPVVKDGKLDMSGFKMRVTGAYRPLLNRLNATPVQIPAAEVYTGLERGVIDGFGWPSVGLNALGLGKVAKYRIDPPFYHLANAVLINLDKWNSMSKEAQDLISKVAREYETASVQHIKDAGTKDAAGVAASGVEIFKLEGDAEKAYLKSAYDAMWARAGKKIPAEELATLRAKLYTE